MSSHREAPEISKDPVADNTDTYAFVSPDDPGTVTIITNYIPLQYPAGGPNFFEFRDDVLYQVNVHNDGDGVADVVFEFRFTTTVANPDTFLYNTGPISTAPAPAYYSAELNRRQTYTVARLDKNRGGKGAKRTMLGKALPCPPCNIGPLSTGDYPSLAAQAVVQLGDVTVFAGQRLEGFYVDLGSVFDLLELRPFANLHLLPMAATPGIDGTQAFNVHTIAVKVPIEQLTADGSAPTDPLAAGSTIGVWGSAFRKKARIRDDGGMVQTGPFVQVSRLGNPLFNEVIVPMGDKDRWNRVLPRQDKAFLKYVQSPELQALIPALYPGVFPNLASITGPRADLVAILLTGIPAGIIPGFQNFTGTTYADELRLNVAVPPSASPNINGILGGDLAGFPNGRRVFDDVVAIELRAVAGATYGLVSPGYTPDAAAAVVDDGVVRNPDAYLSEFPYLGHPVSGAGVAPPAAVA